MGEILSGLKDIENVPLAILLGALAGLLSQGLLRKYGLDLDLEQTMAAGALVGALLQRVIVDPWMNLRTDFVRRRDMLLALAEAENPLIVLSGVHRAELRLKIASGYLAKPRRSAGSEDH